jgi:hypothetical protein
VHRCGACCCKVLDCWCVCNCATLRGLSIIFRGEGCNRYLACLRYLVRVRVLTRVSGAPDACAGVLVCVCRVHTLSTDCLPLGMLLIVLSLSHSSFVLYNQRYHPCSLYIGFEAFARFNWGPLSYCYIVLVVDHIIVLE